MAEGARNHEERGGMAAPEFDVEYLGEIATKLFELQAERAQLEGEGASKKEIAALDVKIAPLQSFVDEHAEDYRRMEMPAEKMRVAEPIPLTRKKAKAETAPDAERIDAESERSQLMDLRVSYARALETGVLPTGGEILLRGALATIDDALNRYSSGELSAEAFQKRGREIVKARKAWDRYITDVEVEAKERKDVQDEKESDERWAKAHELYLKDLERAHKEISKESRAEENAEIKKRLQEVGRKQEAAKPPFQLSGEVNGVEYMVSWVGGKEQRFEAFFPQIKTVFPPNAEMKNYRVFDQIFIIEGTDKKHAKDVFDKIGEILKTEKNPYRAYAKAEAFEQGKAWVEPGNRKIDRANARERISESMERIKTKQKEQRASRYEVKSILEGLAKEKEAAPELAPPPENLPVAPETGAERHATDADIAEKVRIYQGLTLAGREGMYDIVFFECYPKTKRFVSAATRDMIATSYPGWTMEDFVVLRGKLSQEARKKDTARIRVDVRAKTEELKRQKQANETGEAFAERRFFAQGQNPEELAEREKAVERFPELPPDEAVAEQRLLGASEISRFASKVEFMGAFENAVKLDPLHRVAEDKALTFAEQYWDLLQKENKRLEEAMKPRPRVGFFKRLFGGAPKAPKIMSAEDVIRFQTMDKTVRDIMETPSTSVRAQMFRGGMRKGGPDRATDIGRGRPPR